jgi:hypothetical protein
MKRNLTVKTTRDMPKSSVDQTNLHHTSVSNAVVAVTFAPSVGRTVCVCVVTSAGHKLYACAVRTAAWAMAV